LEGDFDGNFNEVAERVFRASTIIIVLSSFTYTKLLPKSFTKRSSLKREYKK
jgi:hypothetical protein